MTETDDLQDLMDVAVSGGILVIAFVVMALIWQIADLLGVNPITGGSDHPDDDGGKWGLNWPL